MPTLTRAALRSNYSNSVLAEDFEIESRRSSESSSPPQSPATASISPSSLRAPLGEISGNNIEDADADSVAMPAVVDDVKNAIGTENKSKGKGTKRGKRGRKGKKSQAGKNENEKSVPEIEIGIEVLEDGQHSATSSAVEDACEELMRESNGEIHQVPMLDNDRPVTPPSQAVHATRKLLSPRAYEVQTPEDSKNIMKSASGPEEDSFLHAIESRTPGKLIRDETSVKAEPMAENNESSEKNATEPEEDSFVHAIASRTPGKLTREENPVKAKQATEVTDDNSVRNKEDSLVEQIVLRSPPKSTMRIEDSVEAIDALEDALERIDEALPKVDDPESPVKTRKVKPVPAEPAKLDTNGRVKVPAGKKTPPSIPVPTKSTVTKKTVTATKTQVSVTKTTSTPMQKPTHLKTRLSVRATPAIGKAPSPKPTESKQSPTSAATCAPETKKRPVGATFKAPFRPAKSTKPPTRPAFELPGEAISRKLKEQREERLKLEEEEKQKKREFKARPIRLSHAPVVKSTAASKARASLLPQQLGKHDHAPTIKPLGRASTIGTDKGARRESVLSVAKRPAANTSAPRAPSFAGSTISRKPSTTGPVAKATVTSTDVAQQKVRAREIFGRDKQEKEERERTKKEKEEAAKKARAEAAERGRQTSREWAEKQKIKKLSSAPAAGSSNCTVEVKADPAVDA